MPREQVQHTIREMVRRIVEGFRPDKTIFSGSHARGEAGPDSDVDLLVVMNVEDTLTERIRAMEKVRTSRNERDESDEDERLGAAVLRSGPVTRV
jgi:predicted nucleotidyltransferase